MKILVSGGAGYIGSHTCVELITEGHEVVIADNLYNSDINILEKIKKITGKSVKFYRTDLTIKEASRIIFEENQFDGVIHFAGYKAVGESVEKPLEYYYNNILSTINLAGLCLEYSVNRFIFSSSATVYGDNEVPFKETMDLKPATNPYGQTKAISERILKDTSTANSLFKVCLLRYFNPVGAHDSGFIGESPKGIPNNLMPYICKVAKGELERLRIFGNDYPTFDGTGIRDYIHVSDLASGHVRALENIKSGVAIYNLGTGKGTSVLELVTVFERVNNVKVPYEVCPRRAGDLAEVYADVTKAKEELGWKAKKNLDDMCKDAWRFIRHNS